MKPCRLISCSGTPCMNLDFQNKSCFVVSICKSFLRGFSVYFCFFIDSSFCSLCIILLPDGQLSLPSSLIQKTYISWGWCGGAFSDPLILKISGKEKVAFVVAVSCRPQNITCGFSILFFCVHQGVRTIISPVITQGIGQKIDSLVDWIINRPEANCSWSLCSFVLDWRLAW